MKTTIVICVILAAFFAAAAHADFLQGDPRKCAFNQPTKCARVAATYTLVHYMRTHGNRSWSNPVKCTPVTGLLRWRCQFGTGSATVWFRALSTGWQRQVTVTLN
jgi:hypothetical protein